MIRPTTIQDVDAIAQLAEASGMFQPDGIETIRETLSQHFNDNSGALWFTADEGEPVGVIYCEREQMTIGTWNTLMLLVRDDSHRKGHGSGLMRHVEQAAQVLGGRLMIVETSGLDDFERARSFYPQLGYREEARIADFYDEGDDKIIFTKVLRKEGL